MRKIYFEKCSLICMYICFKSGILNTVHCKMLDACHNILTLNTSGQSCSHFSQMISIFSIALLRTTPTRVSRKVDADTTVIVSTHCTNFCTDYFSNLLFQIAIKAGTSCHGNRKAGCRSSYYASWSIYKTDIWNAKTFYFFCRIRFYIIMFNQKQIIQ